MDVKVKPSILAYVYTFTIVLIAFRLYTLFSRESLWDISPEVCAPMVVYIRALVKIVQRDYTLPRTFNAELRTFVLAKYISY